SSSTSSTLGILKVNYAGRLSRGKFNDEACEFSFLTLYPDGAAEITNDAEGDTETQTRPTSFPASSEEGIEYFTQIFAFDPDAVVIKLYADNFAVLRGPPRRDSEHFSFIGIDRLRFQREMRIADHINDD